MRFIKIILLFFLDERLFICYIFTQNLYDNKNSRKLVILMKTNIESRYLVLKRIIAYYPSTIFLRNSILQIANEYGFTTIAGICYTTNRVCLFIVLSNCAFSTIEAVYFFTTKEKHSAKFHYASILYILNLNFNLFLVIKFMFKFAIKVIIKTYNYIKKIIAQIPIIIQTCSINLLISFSNRFFSRVSKNTGNLVFFPITASAFVLDNFLEPFEIHWFYKPLPISKGSPFFFH